MKGKLLVVVAMAMMAMLSACGGYEYATLDEATDEATETDQMSPAQVEKLSPDLLPALAEQGSLDILVQADPQVIFSQSVDARVVHEMLSDPAVIWKARQNGAVIWKFTPEQAVIWKTVTDQAVIWKLTEDLANEGYPIEESFASVHAFKLHADLDTVLRLARKAEIAYITPDRPVNVSAVNPVNRTLGVDMVNTRVTNIDFNGYTGAGIAIAVLDSGIRNTHADFGNRIVASKNFTTEGSVTNVNDNYGHGTHVAGLIAGSGRKSVDKNYNTTFEGVAPEANLVVGKVLTGAGQGTVSGVISALEWVLTIKAQYNIRVANLSLGLPAADPWNLDPLCQAVENAVANGLVVVAAAGNYGYYNGRQLYGSIASPGISPSAVTVGASHTRDTVKRMQDANGKNDKVAVFSSRGPTPWTGMVKPDVLAPGVDVISAYAKGSTLANVYPQNVIDACTYGGSPCGAANADYFKMSGTSMAAPIVAGTAALVLEANPSLSPNSVKAVLMLTAQVLLDESSASSCYGNRNWRNDPNCKGLNAIEQGSGLLNVPGAVDLAEVASPFSDELVPGEAWIPNGSIQPVSDFTGTGDQVIWGQGLAWTGGIVIGEPMWSVFQEAYQMGVIWGSGLAWTGGIVPGVDPVFNPPIKNVWSSSFINPLSIKGDNDVLGGFSYDWAAEPDFSDSSDDWFPQV